MSMKYDLDGCQGNHMPHPHHPPAYHPQPHVTYHPPVHHVVVEKDEDPCCPDKCKGEKGDQGDRGPQGYRGEKGEPGQQGDQGRQGDRGVKGDTGDRGERGEKGDKGEKGDQGEKGNTGDKGEKGDPGQDGANGQDGTNGLNGVNGLKGDTGDTGPQGIQGPQGVQGEKGDTGDVGPAGASGFVSKSALDENGCFTQTMLDQNGNEFTCTYQGCVSLLACGYTGNPMCESPTGIPQSISPTGTQAIDLQLPRDSVQIVLQNVAGATGTISNLSTSIEGDYHCVTWDQTGEINFNVLVDTTGLPVATKDDQVCYPPLQPSLRLEAPAGTALNRKVGGAPVANGWSGGTAADGSVYAEEYLEPDYLQNFEEYVEGGVFSADFRGDGTRKVCYKHAFLEPVAAKTSLSGVIQELCDSTGDIPTSTPVTLV